MKFVKTRAKGVTYAIAAGKPFALIGKVRDCVKADLIFSDNTEGNEEKVLYLQRPLFKGGEVKIFEFESPYAARKFAQRMAEKLEDLI